MGTARSQVIGRTGTVLGDESLTLRHLLIQLRFTEINDRASETNMSTCVDF